MQGTKNEINRKQRKLFSRDRSGIQRNNGRLRSKDLQQVIGADHLSPKPKYLLLGARDELSSLKDQFSKLSCHGNHKSAEQGISLQYMGYSPRQKKTTNAHHFDDYKTGTRPEKSKSHRSKSKEELTILKGEEKQISVEMQQLTSQLQEFKKKNKELLKVNQQLQSQMGHLGKHFQQEYETRLKQMQKHQDILNTSQDHERTVIIQKQNQEQEKVIEQLRDNIQEITRSNAELRFQVQRLRADVDQTRAPQSPAINQEMQNLRTQLQNLQKEKSGLQQKLRLKEEQVQRMAQELSVAQRQAQREALRFQQIKSKCDQLQQQVSSLKKSVESHKKLLGMKADERTKRQIQQLQYVISMQVKSIQNYESDMGYLQNKLKKTSQLKTLNTQISLLNSQTNMECVRLNAELLNSKYSKR